MWNLKKKSYTNELIYKTETVWTYGYQRGRIEG